MTKFIFIRHGRPDYKPIDHLASTFQLGSLAFLSDLGIEQAKQVARNSELKDAQLILSSPYTRALHTATFISNEIGIPIQGELELHEWIPDLEYRNQSNQQLHDCFNQARQDFIQGIECEASYESMRCVRRRVLTVLKKYLNYQKVIVVAHEGVMFSLSKRQFQNCEMLEIEYSLEQISELLQEKNLLRRNRI